MTAFNLIIIGGGAAAFAAANRASDTLSPVTSGEPVCHESRNSPARSRALGCGTESRAFMRNRRQSVDAGALRVLAKPTTISFGTSSTSRKIAWDNRFLFFMNQGLLEKGEVVAPDGLDQYRAVEVLVAALAGGLR